MNLERKTFLLILGVLVVAALITFVLADRVVLQSFRDLEDESAARDLDRVEQALGEESEGLEAIAKDWAHWDDAYRFAQGLEPDFAASNLVETSFAANGVTAMAFVDAAGREVFATGFDAENATFVPAPSRLRNLGPADPLLSPTDASSLTGVLVSDGAPYLVTSSAILTSQQEGPPAGHLVWARAIDRGMMEDIGRLTQIEVVVVPWASLAGTEAGQELAAEGRGTEPVTSDTLAARQRVDDLDGNPVLVLEARLDRDIYGEGIDTIAYLLASTVLVGGGVLVAVILLLDSAVLARLARLTRKVEALGRGGAVEARVEVTGRDEITRLSVEFNRLLARLDRRRADLERSNRDLRSFAAVVGHDLQPPLSTVALNTAMVRVKTRGLQDDEVRARLEKIEATALRMGDRIRSILDYSRVAAEAPIESVDLEEVLKEVVQDLEGRIAASEGRVEARGLPTLEANRTMMLQLFQNLVANSLKYHRPDVAPLVKVHAAAVEGSHSWRITVEDNGKGFDPASFERLRHPFKREEGGPEGHGLGLATCDKIVARHHGRMWAESIPGLGTQIHIELPVAQPAPT